MVYGGENVKDYKSQLKGGQIWANFGFKINKDSKRIKPIE